LQVHPYSDQKTFEEEIVKPWQNRHGTDAQGFLRLKTLVRAITISRAKAVIELPARVDEVHHLNFTAAERERYEAAKIQSRALLDEAISSGNQCRKAFNALWLLNNLRLICNHGLLARSTMENKPPQTTQGLLGRWTPGESSKSLYGDILGGAASCLNCGANLLEDILEGLVSSGIETQRQATPSEQTVCAQCSSQPSDDQTGQPSWFGQGLLDSSESSAPATPTVDFDAASTINSMSTKIKALLTDLEKHSAIQKRYPSDSILSCLHKRLTLGSVVFSYWTNTLDFVQLMLNETGIPYTRIDGKTSLRKRGEALSSFQNDDSTRVILVSITCGGAG
jgi:SNF2 family DNA or RNA helicase